MFFAFSLAKDCFFDSRACSSFLFCSNDALFFETSSCSKSRKFVDGKSVLTQLADREDYNGKDILIIDDICVYGGTFVGLSKLLRERNCGKLYLAVSHITVQRLGQSLEDAFDGIFTTNSKYDSYEGQRSHGPVVFTNDSNVKVIKMFDITKINN